MSNERWHFYQNWFSEERKYFASKIAEFPTHCIIDPKIYHSLIEEILRNKYTLITKEEVDKYLHEEVCYMGTWIKPGVGKEQFNFYKEETR